MHAPVLWHRWHHQGMAVFLKTTSTSMHMRPGMSTVRVGGTLVVQQQKKCGRSAAACTQPCSPCVHGAAMEGGSAYRPTCIWSKT